jgi:hypothetical protein
MVVVPNAVHRRLLGASHPLASDQKYAHALARQLNYNNPNFNFNNLGGYEGMGYGGNSSGFNSIVAWKSFTNPIYVVGPTQPKVKVWLVNEETPKSAEELSAEETLRTGSFNENVQAGFLEVPMPELSKVLFGQLGSVGTDDQCIVWQPSTGGLWEMHRIAKFLHSKEEGGHKVTAGEWKIGYGAFHNANTWNGIGTEAGLVSASGLYCAGGMITLQDIIEVLRGGEIKHAIGMYAIVRRNEFIAPAVSHDTASNQFKEYENAKKEKVPNPAYTELGYETKAKEEKSESAKGWRDAVPEGAWFRLPQEATAGEFSLTGKVETAIFNAIRNYGLVVQDGGGACGIYVEDYHTLGSPYCYANVNPYGGYNTAGQDLAQMNAINAVIPSSWTDSTLPAFTEQFESTNSLVYKLWEKCAGSLQQIEPFSS